MDNLKESQFKSSIISTGFWDNLYTVQPLWKKIN